MLTRPVIVYDGVNALPFTVPDLGGAAARRLVEVLLEHTVAGDVFLPLGSTAGDRVRISGSSVAATLKPQGGESITGGNYALAANSECVAIAEGAGVWRILNPGGPPATYPWNANGASGQTLPDTWATIRTRDNAPSQLVGPLNPVVGMSWLLINDGVGTWTMPDGGLTILTKTARILVLIETAGNVYKFVS